MVLVDQGEGHIQVVGTGRMSLEVDTNTEEALNLEEVSNHVVDLNNEVNSSIEGSKEALDVEGDLSGDITPEDMVAEPIDNNSSNNNNNPLILLSLPPRSCSRYHNTTNLPMDTTHHPYRNH
jgi:hypothetical protein